MPALRPLTLLGLGATVVALAGCGSGGHLAAHASTGPLAASGSAGRLAAHADTRSGDHPKPVSFAPFGPALAGRDSRSAGAPSRSAGVVAGAGVRAAGVATGAGSRFESVVASARNSVTPVYGSRRAHLPRLELDNPNPDGAPLVFLVKRLGRKRAEVHLPSRPNGSTGWINRSDVRLASDPYRASVNLERHRITVWNGPRVIVRAPVGVGQAVSPTPAGVYYITELLKQPDPYGVYGPYAFGLSAHSNIAAVRQAFPGSNGEIGLHGTNNPGGLGTDVSHGCIRLRNSTITRLARLLPAGTPVRIVTRTPAPLPATAQARRESAFVGPQRAAPIAAGAPSGALPERSGSFLRPVVFALLFTVPVFIVLYLFELRRERSRAAADALPAGATRRRSPAGLGMGGASAAIQDGWRVAATRGRRWSTAALRLGSRIGSPLAAAARATRGALPRSPWRDSRAEIVALQRELNELRATTNERWLPEDGVYGAKTAGRVSQFQSRHGLKVSGACGDETRAAIAEAARDARPDERSQAVDSDDERTRPRSPSTNGHRSGAPAMPAAMAATPAAPVSVDAATETPEAPSGALVGQR